jgi:hypothetical protein
MVAVEDELHVRFPFTARAEIIRENISAVVIAQVTEISSHGCYLEFVQLEKGSRVLVKIFARGDFFEAGANVVYSQPVIGTALVFRSIQPHFADLLKKWLAGAVEKQSDIRLECVNGSVRIYLRGFLHLEAPYITVAPTPTIETDTQLKRWADYLGKTNSEDSAARFFGKSALEADGFRQGKDSVWRRD